MMLMKNILIQKRSSTLSAIPNWSNIDAIVFYEIIDFIGHHHQISILSYVRELFIFPAQIRHRLKIIDTMDNLPNSSFRHLLTGKLTIELVNSIKFVWGAPQPMNLMHHNAHEWMSGLYGDRFGNLLQLHGATTPFARRCRHTVKAFCWEWLLPRPAILHFPIVLQETKLFRAGSWGCQIGSAYLAVSFP